VIGIAIVIALNLYVSARLVVSLRRISAQMAVLTLRVTSLVETLETPAEVAELKHKLDVSKEPT